MLDKEFDFNILEKKKDQERFSFKLLRYIFK